MRLHSCVPAFKCDEMGVQGVEGDEERGGRGASEYGCNEKKEIRACIGD